MDCLRKLADIRVNGSKLKNKTKTKLKTTTLRKAAAAGLTALVIGNAAAQESVSKPVGYETITIPNGFSYAGLRLHEAPVASGEVVGVAGTTLTFADGVIDALTAGTTYILEVADVDSDAFGAVVVVDSFDAAADTATLNLDISADYFAGDGFTLRPAATLASVFGTDNEAGLDGGAGGPDGDVVYIPNAAGEFDRYYYDTFNGTTFGETWANAADNSPVTAADVPIIYTDGLVFLGAKTDNNTFVVSGSVKLTDTAVTLGDGFNYLGTIFPVGSTLASAFGAANESGLTPGAGGPDGDVIYVPAAGGFDRYYYDSFNGTTFGETWANAANNLPIAAPESISFDDASGIIVLHPGAAVSVNVAAPAFYSTL